MSKPICDLERQPNSQQIITTDHFKNLEENAIKQQDHMLSQIENNVNKLKETSQSFNSTLNVQSILIDQIDTKVNKSTTNLEKTNKKITKIENKKRSPCMCAIIILMIFILLFLVAILVSLLVIKK